MTLPIVLGLDAEADLRRVFSWYEQEQSGLGRRCLSDIASTLGHIEWFPHGYQRVDGEVRAAPVRQFPLRVYYRVRAADVYVVAVLTDRLDPQSHQRRLSDDH